jgi:hypothetical protein
MESRLKKYISSLSEEEKVLYKPLIEDALRREESQSLVAAEAKAQVEMYEYQLNRLRETTLQFHAGISRLNGKLAGLAAYSELAASGRAGEAAVDGRHSRLRH